MFQLFFEKQVSYGLLSLGLLRGEVFYLPMICISSAGVILQLRTCYRITCTSCLSVFPIVVSKSLAVARYGYVFLLALGKTSCAICASYF